VTGSIALLCLAVPLALYPVGEGPTGPTGHVGGIQCDMGERLPVMRLEQWEENAPLGGALEGFHAWAASEMYGALRDQGLDASSSGAATLLAGLGVELLEVSVGDARGISVQDLAANCLGVVAASTGLAVRYQYVAYLDAPARYEGLARIPIMPVNGHSNSMELGPPGVGPCLGLKYVGESADVAVGFAAMPVLPRESGAGVRIPYIGYHCQGGFSFAVGVRDASARGTRQLELGAGYRLESEHIGIVFQALLADAEHGWGVSVFPR